MKRNIRTGGPQEHSAVELLAWSAAVVVTAFLLVMAGFRTQDADSGLHVNLVLRLAELPVSQWIAPQWWGVWGFHGPYREHPAGIVLLPLLLHKMGYPLEQAPFLANAIYQAISLLLIQRIAAFLVAPVEARATGWLVQLLPIAFTYRIRANHEDAVLMFFLVALWSTERSRTNARWILVTASAAAGTFLVKGLFAVFLLLPCIVWLLAVRRRDGASRRLDLRAWAGVGCAAAAVLAAAAGYEYLYRAATGESFLSVYLSRQLGAAASPRAGSMSVINKLHNLVSYTARLLWFAFPASLAAVAAAWTQRFGFRTDETSVADGLRFAVGTSALYVFAFALSDRIADRYIFPAYYLLGACGWVALLRSWKRLRQLAERLDGYQPFVAPAAWLLLIILNLVNGALGVPVTKL